MMSIICQALLPGRGALPTERVPRARAELLGFLLAPTAVVAPPPLPASLFDEAAAVTTGLRRQWCGDNTGGAAGLAGVLWDAAGLPAEGDVDVAASPLRHRLPQRLAFLLGVETSVTLDILREALEGWDATESECLKVGPARQSPPHHTSQFRPWFIESNGSSRYRSSNWQTLLLGGRGGA